MSNYDKQEEITEAQVTGYLTFIAVVFVIVLVIVLAFIRFN
jgi:hypothetical protein